MGLGRSGTVLLAIAAALAVLVWRAWSTDVVLAWMAAVSVVTFLTFAWDKAVAGTRAKRVPERTLLLLAFAGGTLGALAGSALFRHKTIKASFRARFWAVVALQLALIVAYVVWLEPRA